MFDGLFASISFEPNCIMNDPYSSDFIILGAGQLGNPSVLRCNYNFTLVEHHIIVVPLLNDVTFPQFYSDHWLSSDTLLVFGTLCPYGVNKPYVYFGKINKQGVICEATNIDKPDTLNYAIMNHAMCTANDSTIYLIPYAVLGDWMGPQILEVYVANKDLEILGYKAFYNELRYWPNTAIATNDDGLVTISDKYATAIHIKKFLREDFNPIPCSVKEVPKEQIKATAFPNPTARNLSIDISGIDIQGGQTRIKIFDCNGRICLDRIIRGEGNLLSLDLSSLNSGTYSYQITFGNKVLACDKFIKN